MKTKIEGRITPETILSQCIRMSNDNIWAAFEYCPHLARPNKVIVRVRLANVENSEFYNSFYEPNYDKDLPEILQDLIGLEYQYQEQQSAKDAK